MFELLLLSQATWCIHVCHYSDSGSGGCWPGNPAEGMGCGLREDSALENKVEGN